MKWQLWPVRRRRGQQRVKVPRGDPPCLGVLPLVPWEVQEAPQQVKLPLEVGPARNPLQGPLLGVQWRVFQVLQGRG